VLLTYAPELMPGEDIQYFCDGKALVIVAPRAQGELRNA